MNTLTSNQENPRIACFQIPPDTWALCALLLVVAVLVRFFGGDQTHLIADNALFLIFVVTAFEFLIAFCRPNTITGGAKLQTVALAGVAALGLLVIH